MKTLKMILFFYSGVLIFSCGGSGGGSNGIFENANNVLQETFSETQTIRIKIPSLPISVEKSFSDVTYKLIYLDQKLNLQTAEFNSDKTDFEISVAKNQTTPILLFPIISGFEFFLPAGAIYPNNMEENRKISLLWQNGQSAKTLLCVYEALSDFTLKEKIEFCNYFNWTKLQEKYNSVKNSHLININNVATAICSGEFTASDVKVPKTYKVQLDLPQKDMILFCKDITKEPLKNGQFLEYSRTGEEFLTTNKKVFVETFGSDKNRLVITELAR